MLIQPGKLLSAIDSPADLKKLKPEELVKLSTELRDFIIDNVSVYGGHFGASLGVVELTVALHYVFNTPEDQHEMLKSIGEVQESAPSPLQKPMRKDVIPPYPFP